MMKLEDVQLMLNGFMLSLLVNVIALSALLNNPKYLIYVLIYNAILLGLTYKLSLKLDKKKNLNKGKGE